MRQRAAAVRVDPAHVTASQPAAAEPNASGSAALEPASPVSAVEAATAITVQQVRSQAAQLAGHLQRQQAIVDHREAELNSRLAAMENQIRSARLWLNERQAELSQQTAELDRRDADIAQREAELAGGPKSKLKGSRAGIQTEQEERAAELDRREAELTALAERWAERVASAEQVQDVQQLLHAIETRSENLDRAEKLMTAEQAELQRQRRQLDEERAVFAASSQADRQKRAEDEQRAIAECDRTRHELKRQADELAARQGTLERMRADVARSQQEALEIRLATEELWSRLCGTMAPAALTQSLAQIRLKLAEEQRLARADVAQQKAEVQALAACLAEQHKKLARDREDVQAWANQRQKELEKQAAVLVAQQHQAEDRLAAFHEQTREWQSERFRLQQEIRRLLRQVNRAEIAAA